MGLKPWRERGAKAEENDERGGQEGRRTDEANLQRSFLCCLFLQLRITEENKDKRAIGYRPGLDDFDGHRR